MGILWCYVHLRCFSAIRPTSAPNAAEPLDALRRRGAAAAVAVAAAAALWLQSAEEDALLRLQHIQSNAHRRRVTLHPCCATTTTVTTLGKYPLQHCKSKIKAYMSQNLNCLENHS